MRIDDHIKSEKMILTEKLQKYLPDHQVKLICMNISQVKKYYLLIKKKNNRTK